MAYFVYIMTKRAGTLYTGMTNDLERRVYEHKHHMADGFTERYKMHKLVYCEDTNDVQSAIAREKQIKGWLRRKKVELIDSMNPIRLDLAEEWQFTQSDPSPRSGCHGGRSLSF